MVEKPKPRYTWTSDSFEEIWEYNLSANKTYIQTYYDTEEEHRIDCGVYKYKSYNSFRGCRNSKIKKM